MSWVPGWDSVASASWWSSLYFWLSIVALIGLGVFEVASHRYSDRKDELAAAEQKAIQRRHDDEMTRLHLETAKANENAEATRERAAQLEITLEQERAARLRLQRQSADRTIDDEQRAILSRVIAAGPPNIRVFLSLLSDQEAAAFGEQLARALKDAGATIAGIGRGNTIYPPPIGVIVEVSALNAPSMTILRALQEAGIEASSRPTFPEAAMVRLTVGVKPNPK